MRFRPLGGSGMAVSAVSLCLTDSPGRTTPQAWVQLLYSAFENGVNAFEVVGRQPALAEGLAQAVAAVERRLLFIALRLGPVVSPAGAILRDFSPESLLLQVESFLTRTRLEYVDAVILDDPKADELSPQALDGLKAMREAGRTRMLGVGGDDPAIDAYISAGAFDLLRTPFSLVSGWKDRLRLKAAMERDMAVIGYGFFPEQFHGGGAAPAKKGWWGGARSAGRRRHLRLPRAHVQLDRRGAVPGLRPHRTLAGHRADQRRPHRTHRRPVGNPRARPAAGRRRPDRNGPLRGHRHRLEGP